MYIFAYIYINTRRKLRSQTSDSMNRWESRGGKSQRRVRKKKKEDQRRERIRRKKRWSKRKRSREALCFSNVLWLWRVEKVGSLKRRVRSYLTRWEIKNCTPLRCETDLEVKMPKTLHAGSTFGSWAVEKLHAIVAQSRFRSQTDKSTSGFRALSEVEMWKKCTPLWREAGFQIKML